MLEHDVAIRGVSVRLYVCHTVVAWRVRTSVRLSVCHTVVAQELVFVQTFIH